MSRRPPDFLNHRYVPSLAVAVLVLVGVGLFSGTKGMTMLEDMTRDWRFLLRGRQPVRVPITIIEIDQGTLDSEQFAQPFIFWGPIHARVFRVLHKLGAKAIGFDLIQSEPLSDYADPDLDKVVSEALAAIPEMVLTSKRRILPPGKVTEVQPADPFFYALQIGGGKLALDNLTPEPDDVVRSQILFDTDKEKTPSFPLAVASVATNSEPRFEAGAVIVGGKRVRVDSDDRCLINYVGPNHTFPRISYRDLLANPKEAGPKVKGSLCLIGVTSLDFADYHAVPFTRGHGGDMGYLMAGVEVHANTIHTLLTGDAPRLVGPIWTWVLMALAVVLSVPLSRLPRVYQIIAGLVALLAGWALCCVWAFEHATLLLPWVPTALALVVSQFLLLAVRLHGEAAHRKWVEGLFGRYVSPQVLGHLLANPGAIELGGQRQVITVLFADIRAFTTLSERLDPERVTALLNEYLTAMVEIVFAHGGMVDKYIGDAVMTLFNWPVPQPDHAMRAVQTAVEMYEQVVAMRDHWANAGLGFFDIGIGLHTGPAVLGNVGAPSRMDHTAIGDTVNVASRLEHLNKKLQTNILISQTTRALIDERFDLRHAGDTEIRGRTETIDIYAVIPPSLQVGRVK